MVISELRAIIERSAAAFTFGGLSLRMKEFRSSKAKPSTSPTNIGPTEPALPPVRTVPAALLKAAKAALGSIKASRLTAYLRQPDTRKLSIVLDCCAPGKRQLLAASEIPEVLADLTTKALGPGGECLELRAKTISPELAALFEGRAVPALAWIFPIWDVSVLQGWICLEFESSHARKSEPARKALLPLVQALGAAADASQNSLSALDALTMFLDATSDGVVIVSSGALRVLYANDAAHCMLKLPKPMDQTTLVLTDFRPARLSGAWTSMLDDLESLGVWSGDLALVTTEQRRISAPTFALRFRQNSQDGAWAFAIIFRDPATGPNVSNTRLREIIDALGQMGPHFYYVFTVPDQELIAGADRVAEKCGYTVEEVMKHPQGWASLVHAADLPQMNRSVRKLLGAPPGHQETCRVRFGHKNGHWESIDVTHRVLERDAEGRPASVIGISQLLAAALEPAEELKRREALYREMVDEASDFIFICDPNGLIMHSNEHIERMTGFKRHEVVGRALWQLLELPENARLTPDLAALGRQRIPQVTCKLQCHNGGTIVVDLRLRRLSDQRYLGIARDISREVALADENYRQAAYYRGLFHNNISGVAVFDEKLHIIAANPALCRLLHRREKTLLGTSVLDIVAPECAEVARESFHRMRHDRRFNQRFRTGTKLTLLRQDFTPVYTQASLTAVSDGIVLFCQGIAIFTDITDETRLRDERDQQARLTEALVSDAPTCIVVTDPSGLVIRVNPAVEELTGFPAKHFLGKRIWDLGIMDPKSLPSTMENWRDQFLKGRRVSTTLKLLTRSGESRIVDVQSTTALAPDGKLLCVITTATDVTEQRRLEAEVIKIAEEAQMRIGHDLHDGVGQVLTGIISLTEALETQLEGPTLREAARIRELVREAINQVRDLSHTLSPAAVKNRGLAAALRLLASQVRHRQLECEVEIECEPKLDNPDKETHLFRIAQEAVNNAIKHGKPKRISLSLKRLSEDHCLMIIQDDGLGISPRKAKRKTGIGVRVMGYRANLLGGIFEIRPLSAGGTIVTCRFPCAY